MAVYYIVVVAAKESYMCGSCSAAVNAPIQLPRAVTAAQISVMNLTWLSLFTNNKHSHRSSVKHYRCQPTAAEVWRQASAIDMG